MVFLSDRVGQGACAPIHPSKSRHTAQHHEFWAKLYYPYHPQSGEDIYVVGKRLHRGEQCYVILGDDRKQNVVPEWMTRSESENVSLVSRPCLELEALRYLRSLINLKIVSLPNQEQSITGRENDSESEQSATPRSTSPNMGKYPITHKASTGNSKNTH